MAIIITDADDAIYMTKAEYKYWETRYDIEFQNHLGAVPTLEEYIRHKQAQARNFKPNQPAQPSNTKAEVYRSLM